MQLINRGGVCALCLESSNWLLIDQNTDTYTTFYTLECQTPRLFDNGEFAWLCENEVIKQDERY